MGPGVVKDREAEQIVGMVQHQAVAAVAAVAGARWGWLHVDSHALKLPSACLHYMTPRQTAGQSQLYQ